MKIASTSPAVAAREHPRAAAKANSETSFALTNETTAAPTAKPAGSEASKAIPPGLAKVQARLMEIAAEQRTHGQSQALSVISRNIARYSEQQSAATPPQTVPEAPAEAADPTPVVPPAETTADAPAEAANPTPAAVETTAELPAEAGEPTLALALSQAAADAQQAGDLAADDEATTTPT